MLATLALFVCGLSVFMFARRRKTHTLHINGTLIRRDLKFFLLSYAIAAIIAFLPEQLWFMRYVGAALLLPIYGVYVLQTLKTGESTGDSELKDLYTSGFIRKCTPSFWKKPAGEPHTLVIITQVLMALSGIILGAYMFVGQIEDIATIIGINPLILSLVISPIATELPEKFNSMLWIRDRKDTFAIGNITGAMVFQSCIPVTIGLLFTTWHLNIGDKIQFLEALSIGIALLSAVVLYIRSSHKEIHISGLMLGGALYLVFFVAVLLSL
jgi:cation:H+ antiporter